MMHPLIPIKSKASIAPNKRHHGYIIARKMYWLWAYTQLIHLTRPLGEVIKGSYTYGLFSKVDSKSPTGKDSPQVLTHVIDEVDLKVLNIPYDHFGEGVETKGNVGKDDFVLLVRSYRRSHGSCGVATRPYDDIKILYPSRFLEYS